MKKYLMCLCSVFVLIGCSSFSGNDEIVESWTNEPTDKFYLSLGGVYPGRDELIIYDDSGEVVDFKDGELTCEVSNSGIIELASRSNFDSLSNGSGALIVPKGVGLATITCSKNKMPLNNIYGVVVPPQELIQILLGEAGQQIKDEANYDGDNVVSLSSRSPTAEALVFVIKNRVNMVRDEVLEPGAFMADEELFESDPPASNYFAIIEAEGQFLPVDDPENIYYTADNRNNLSSVEWRIAYDQAVLSAGQVFVGDLDDPTCGEDNKDYDPFCGAYGFKSPTEEEWKLLKTALDEEATSLPDGCGISESESSFFSPKQVLILNDVWKYPDGRPAFVFIRKRGDSEPAVTDIP